MDRGAWWAMVQRTARSRTRLRWLSTHTEMASSLCGLAIVAFKWRRPTLDSLVLVVSEARLPPCTAGCMAGRRFLGSHEPHLYPFKLPFYV